LVEPGASDALLPRPGGGTPGDYVNEPAARLALLGIKP